MYQYGNVAVKYQKEKKIKPKQRQVLNHQPIEQKNPVTKQVVHTQRKTFSTGEKLLYIFSVIGAVILLSFILQGYSTISQLNYEVQSMEAELKTIHEQNTNLQLIVAEYSSPDRIITIAKRELGMTEKNPNVKVFEPVKASSFTDSTSEE